MQTYKNTFVYSIFYTHNKISENMKKKLIFATILLLFIQLQSTPPTNEGLFGNKNILVLGGTGYLGRAITENLLKYKPKQVTIFSRDEVKHFNISKIYANNPLVRSIIGDIRDYDALEKAMVGTDIVFHVAALKRMDSLETHVAEAIKTNVLGSMNVFKAAIAHGVDKVLFISTDKACSPINTYGACKFVSEKIFTNYDKTSCTTKFMATRFGNILESTGSVIPFFTERIKSGADIPLTDERMTRFIINKEEAVELIFDALRYGTGGEIFLKRMPAMKITDLITVLNRKYNKQSVIRVIGLRPGEKLHETLINESELHRAYKFNNYYVITPSIPQSADTNIPLYIAQGTNLATLLNKEYSSDQEVVSTNELEKLFVRLNLFS